MTTLSSVSGDLPTAILEGPPGPPGEKGEQLSTVRLIVRTIGIAFTIVNVLYKGIIIICCYSSIDCKGKHLSSSITRHYSLQYSEEGIA